MPDLDPADPPRVVPLTVVDRRRPDPPPEMPEREAELWRAIVNSRRPGWIDNPGSALVLELYCHAVAVVEGLEARARRDVHFSANSTDRPRSSSSWRRNWACCRSARVRPAPSSSATARTTPHPGRPRTDEQSPPGARRAIFAARPGVRRPESRYRRQGPSRDPLDAADRPGGRSLCSGRRPARRHPRRQRGPHHADHRPGLLHHLRREGRPRRPRQPAARVHEGMES